MRQPRVLPRDKRRAYYPFRFSSWTSFEGLKPTIQRSATEVVLKLVNQAVFQASGFSQGVIDRIFLSKENYSVFKY